MLNRIVIFFFYLFDFFILLFGVYLLFGSEFFIMWDDIFLNFRYEWRIIKFLKSCFVFLLRVYRMMCRKCELFLFGLVFRELREIILRIMWYLCFFNILCSWLFRGRFFIICCLLCCVGGYRVMNGLLFICLGLFLFWKKNFCWGKGLVFKEFYIK